MFATNFCNVHLRIVVVFCMIFSVNIVRSTVETFRRQACLATMCICVHYKPFPCLHDLSSWDLVILLRAIVEPSQLFNFETTKTSRPSYVVA